MIRPSPISSKKVFLTRGNSMRTKSPLRIKRNRRNSNQISPQDPEPENLCDGKSKLINEFKYEESNIKIKIQSEDDNELKHDCQGSEDESQVNGTIV